VISFWVVTSEIIPSGIILADLWTRSINVVRNLQVRAAEMMVMAVATNPTITRTLKEKSAMTEQDPDGDIF